MKAQATEQLKFHIQERLPWEHRICSEGLSLIIKHAWSIILEGDTKENKIAALSLIAQCYKGARECLTKKYKLFKELSDHSSGSQIEDRRRKIAKKKE